MENVADEKYIELICNGEFNAIPDFKIGELFESFFDNINYNVVKENGEAFVDFTGDAFCDDEPCVILIRFKIDSNVEEFEIAYVKVNEDTLDEDEVIDLLEDIAYVGGAALSEEYSCTEESCANCMHHCGDYHDEEDDDENDEDNEDEDEDEN